MQSIRDPHLRWLVEVTLSHDARKKVWVQSSPRLLRQIPPGKSWFNQGPERGLPIGNLTSQFGSNVYLNGLDHFVLRTLKPGAYLRYMDDLTLLDCDSARLRDWIDPIDQWLRKERAQELNSTKTKLTELRLGIDYLGYRLRQREELGGDLEIANPERIPCEHWPVFDPWVPIRVRKPYRSIRLR